MRNRESHERYQLDSVDLRILAVLQEDASMENQELARRVNLSPAPCLRRVRRLKDDGVIKQIVALIDTARLGMAVEVYAFVALENQRTASGQQFEPMLQRRPEVMECVRLSGAYDYLLRVVVESIEAYSLFVDQYVISLSAIRSVNSSFGLGLLKRTTALPLPSPRRLTYARASRQTILSRNRMVNTLSRSVNHGCPNLFVAPTSRVLGRRVVI